MRTIREGHPPEIRLIQVLFYWKKHMWWNWEELNNYNFLNKKMIFIKKDWFCYVKISNCFWVNIYNSRKWVNSDVMRDLTRLELKIRQKQDTSTQDDYHLGIVIDQIEIKSNLCIFHCIIPYLHSSFILSPIVLGKFGSFLWII